MNKIIIKRGDRQYRAGFVSVGSTYADPVIAIKKWYGWKTVYQETESLFCKNKVELYTPNRYLEIFNPIVDKYEEHIKEWNEYTHD